MVAQSRSERQAAFWRSFANFSARVHRRRALRQALTGGGFGLSLGALAAFALWTSRLGELRPFAAALGALGAAGGALWAGRRRWSERDVALYLDARLGSAETLTTALGAGAAEEPALALVVERAVGVLGSADPARVKPPLWSRWHAALPIPAGVIVLVCWLPLPAAPTPPPLAPGAELVRMGDLQGLRRIEALARLHGQNPEQDARLQKLAEQARSLRERLAKGLERREALSEIAKLRDGIAAERLKLADQQNRSGLDAALRAFGSQQALKDAARALSNGDLTAFDDEMQKLANRAESSDRQMAKEALAEAAREARAKGAKTLAEALEAERRLFERRQAHADALRELADGVTGNLSPEARQDLNEFRSSGDPKAAARLEEGLERALEGLSPEERKRLAERLEQRVAGGADDASPMSRREIEELAKKLASEQGIQGLKEELKELAKPESSDDAEREQGLGDADRGGSAAERGLGAIPMPMSEDGSASDRSDKSNAQKSGGDAAAPPSDAGSGHDRGAGEHRGSTPEIAGRELRAKADAHVAPGALMHGATLGRAPARAGETANQLGTGTLGSSRQTEIGAVDHADIPEEYREQVGRYFEP